MAFNAGTPQNPPVPAGWKYMAQGDVTPEMTAWAVEILHDPTHFPMFTWVTRGFVGKNGSPIEVAAAVQWHPPDPPVGPPVTHRGVSLFEQTAATSAPTESPAPTTTTIEGVDVSHYQGRPDWSMVARSGRSFAFIKATEGSAIIDGSFTYNWQAAQGAGLKRGAYHFFRPSQSPTDQADFFVAQLLHDAGELQPVLDVEVRDGLQAKTVIAGVLLWLDHVASKIERPLIYTSPGFWSAVSPEDAAAVASEADLWVAHWGVSVPTIAHGWSAAKFWQYSASGRVPGIVGDVDLDRLAVKVDDFAALGAR